MSSVLVKTIELGPIELETTPADTPAVAPRCGECGTVLYAGECLAVGYCETADRTATRGAARTPAKYRQPAAWTMGGGVD